MGHQPVFTGLPVGRTERLAVVICELLFFLFLCLFFANIGHVFLSLGPVKMQNLPMFGNFCVIMLDSFHISIQKKQNIENIWKKGALFGHSVRHIQRGPIGSFFFFYCKLSQVATT